MVSKYGLGGFVIEKVCRGLSGFAGKAVWIVPNLLRCLSGLVGVVWGSGGAGTGGPSEDSCSRPHDR